MFFFMLFSHCKGICNHRDKYIPKHGSSTHIEAKAISGASDTGRLRLHLLARVRTLLY